MLLIKNMLSNRVNPCTKIGQLGLTMNTINSWILNTSLNSFFLTFPWESKESTFFNCECKRYFAIVIMKTKRITYSISIEFIPLALPYRTEPYRIILYETVFLKILSSHFSSLLNTVTRTVTLNFTFLRIIRWRKKYRCTYRYRYYQYRTLNTNASRAPLQFWWRFTGIVTVFHATITDKWRLKWW